MGWGRTRGLIFFVLLAVTAFAEPSRGVEKRKIIIDQDAAGPAGTDLQSTLLLIQSPQTEVLGITVVTGDAWLKSEMAHTLRMLELIGRTDIPVVPGAENPLVRTKEGTELWEKQYGSVAWLGAWTPKFYHPSDQLGDMPEGMPVTKPADEDAAHFLIRMVHKYPQQVSIYAGGPMTNIALALTIDPEFANLAKELVFMGASMSPVTEDPEFSNTPRHEFNLWFDPEAAHIMLAAPWKKIVCTPVDISVKTRLSKELIAQIKEGNSRAARYVATYARLFGDYNYLWDELAAAAWLDPTLITKSEIRYMDIDLDHGANWGNTLTWSENDRPATTVRRVEIQVDLNLERFYRMFVDAMKSQTPPRD
jgi:purine nucleosidase